MYNENQIVKIKWINRTKKHYESLGYEYTGINTELNVLLKDLLPNSNERVEVSCDMCGDIVTVPWRNYNRIVQRDGQYTCKPCSFKIAMQRRDERKMIQEYQLFLDKCKENNCVPVTTFDEFNGTRTEMYYICPQHDLQHTMMNRITQGAWCYWCGKASMREKQKHSSDTVSKIIASKNGNVLMNPHDYVNSGTNNLIIKCGMCGNSFVSSLAAQQAGGGRCPDCAMKVLSDEMKLPREEAIRRTIIDCKQMMVNTDDYNGQKEEQEFYCTQCGSPFCTTPNNYMRGFTRCENCNASSRGEQRIYKYLDDSNINYVAQYRFDDCKDIKPLPFDCYLPDHNLAIEYNGYQHYIPIDFFGGIDAFIIRQIHDKMKRDYCKRNDINLLVIKWKDDDRLEDMITDKLNLIINKQKI